MRKYREVMRVYLKTQLAWRADVAFSMLFTVSKVLFAWLLWGMVFRERDTVADFTFHGMLSYYIVSSFLHQLEMARGISGEISARIRNGTLSNYLVLPVNMEGYFAAMEAGVVLFYLFFDLSAAVVWVFVFRIQLAFTHSPGLFICAMVMALMGLFFMVQLNYFLGILTLKYEEISTFLMIKDNLAALVDEAAALLLCDLSALHALHRAMRGRGGEGACDSGCLVRAAAGRNPGYMEKIPYKI